MRSNANMQFPLYQQLVAMIEKQIDKGELKPGLKIPSENELCEMYNISRITVRQALSDLALRGKVIRVKGKGTFIPKFSARKPFDGLSGFSNEIKYTHQTQVTSKIISFEATMPTPETAQMLGLSEGKAVIRLERARYLENIGISGVDLRFLPFNRFHGLLEEDLENNSLYNILRSKYNTFPSRAIHEVSGMACPACYADILELTAGEPISHFKDVVYDQNNIPFEFGENFYRIDRYNYRIEISKTNQSFV